MSNYLENQIDEAFNGRGWPEGKDGSALLWESMAELRSLRGNLSLAEEGLANYAQENERLQAERAAAIDRLTPLGCENTDLRAELYAIRSQSLEWAMSCWHDCPACDAMYDLIREGWFPTEMPRKAVAGDLGFHLPPQSGEPPAGAPGVK